VAPFAGARLIREYVYLSLHSRGKAARRATEKKKGPVATRTIRKNPVVSEAYGKAFLKKKSTPL